MVANNKQGQDKKGFIQTVCGLLKPEEMGITLSHEHLLIDQAGQVIQPGKTPSERAKWDQPITLQNRYDVLTKGHLYHQNLILDSVEDAIGEVDLFYKAGGSTIVDATTMCLGREPRGLLAISRGSHVNIVMGCGYYTYLYQFPEIKNKNEEEICEAILSEIVDGVDGIFPGIIGEIGTSWPIHPQEEKVLRAAVKAQVKSGLPLTVHPGRDPGAPLHAMRLVIQAGGDPTRAIMDHVDNRIFDRERLRELAQTGCFLEFDLFGKEDSHGWPPPSWPNDASRVDRMIWLIEDGFLDRLLMSHDVCTKTRLSRYGGPGYHHILERVVPLMRMKGLGTTEINQILVDNPARAMVIQ